MPISTLSDEHHQYGYTIMAYLSPSTRIAVRYGIRGSVTIVDRMTRTLCTPTFLLGGMR